MLPTLFFENLKPLALKPGISRITAITGRFKSRAMTLLWFVGWIASAEFEGFHSSSCPLAVD